ncbi:MAG: cation:proton antiporter, partial [Prevotella sp.]
SSLPYLIKDLALILVVAGIVTIVFKKLRQPLVLGYVVAGFLVSPHMPYIMSVVDRTSIRIWGDIGVIFLLFSLGLDFSFKKIIKSGISPIISTCSIVFFMMMTGLLTGKIFGWGRMDCIFLGGMLAMSSTTIIYKAFDDLGLRQQRFAGIVMSVLILEDILAIVMMVMLSAIANGNNPDGGQMLGSLMKIGFFLVLWFVVGIFLIPLMLRSMRKLINNETLLIVALGLCCAMAVLSSKVGFSSAFGAFVMGSILAETVEADRIVKLVEPVKNLFGAVFFVSVGMLVDPAILIAYWLPILVLVIAILLGQAIFGSFSFFISGQSLKSALQCGFSMAQIGEFSFIIASLGLSLGVIGDFVYPVVVAVSVITTFLTPYMIRMANPCYNILERHLPNSWIKTMNNITVSRSNIRRKGNWKNLIKQLLRITVVYSILSAAAIALMFTFFLPFIRHLLPHWWANAVCGLLTLAIISPFLRAIMMKKNHSDEFRALWGTNTYNKLLLLLTIAVRLIITSAFVFYICNYLTRFTDALMISIAVAAVCLMVLSRSLKKHSIKIERLFMRNLRSREIMAQVMGHKKPLYEGRLLDRDIHIADLDIPEDSLWCGKTLSELRLRNRFGVHISSILRGVQRINIPNGKFVIFPGDKIQVIGSDEQLTALTSAIKTEIYEKDPEIEKREMRLHQIIINGEGSLVGKTIMESGIRDKYNCMIVGMEEGKENLSQVDPQRIIKSGDIIWIVGEQEDIDRIDRRN